MSHALPEPERSHPPIETRAPHALPALILGIAAVICALVLSSVLGALLGIGATMLAGIAYADHRSHGYTGEGLAITGGIFGVVAVIMMFVSFLLL
jgi:hypothetical protein